MSLLDNPRIMLMPSGQRDWTAFIRELNFAMNRDFYFEVAAGNVAGYKAVNKFGLSTNVDSGIATDLHDGANPTDDVDIWVAPTAARIHALVSTDAEVTGAAAVKVYGLTDWDTPEVSETVTMNGTTPVNTSNSYVIIHRLLVTSTGVLGPNIGVITATAASDGTVTAQINAGEGQTQMAIYGISSKETAFCTGFYLDVLGNTSTVSIDAKLLWAFDVENEETVFQTKHELSVLAGSDNPLQHFYNPPNAFSGPGILKVQAIGSTNNLEVSGGFDLVVA